MISASLQWEVHVCPCSKKQGSIFMAFHY
jgi:hypothetical protein